MLLILQVHLNPEDVIVCEIHIDQGMKAENPMLNVRFYQTASAEGGDEPFAMPQQQVTSMLGTVYQGMQLAHTLKSGQDPCT